MRPFAAHFLGYLEQPVFPGTALRFYSSLHDRPVAFLHFALAKLLGQALCRLGAAGEKRDAGDRAIEAMRNAQVDIAQLLIALLEIGLRLCLQRRNSRRRTG